MNKDRISNGKPFVQSRGRWSLRLNNELLDLVQKDVYSWDTIAKKLGFSENVESCIYCLCVGMQTAI